MEALEALNKLTSNPRIEPGQYGEVCAVLKKVYGFIISLIFVLF